MTRWKQERSPRWFYLTTGKWGTAQSGILMARFRNGMKDYAIGNEPVWEMFRTLHRDDEAAIRFFPQA